MTTNTYHVTIIGAGLTGLSTAIAYKKLYPEHRVLVIEKHSTVGGCVSTFAREGYRFDTVQIIPDVSEILRFFEIDVELVRFSNYYARLFLANPETKTAKVYPIASSVEGFKTYLTQTFTDDAQSINRFFEYCSKMYHELHYLKTEPRLADMIKILFHCPRIIANSNKTYKEFLQKFGFKNNDLIQILDTFSSFSGLSGNRCAALLTACAMITTLHGAYRPVTGFIQFPNLLKTEFEKTGGEVRLKTEVKHIAIENGIVKGVVLENDEVIHSEIVVSTADTKVTFEKMIGHDTLNRIDKKFATKVHKAEMSPSALTIHLGLDDFYNLREMGFDCGYNVLTTGRSTHEKMFDKWEQNEVYLSDNEFHMAVISPSVKTGGKPNLIIRVVPFAAQKWIDLRATDYQRYCEEKEKVADFYIKKVEEYMLPELRKHILFKDISSPATYARYIHTPTGSNYDMMPVPENFGKNRLKTRTPIKNLFVPKFSHGIWPSMQAGLQVVDMISGGKIMNGNSRYGKPINT